MKTTAFLEHHGIVENPFSDEDAQTDLVFKTYCIANTYHPSWDKVYGTPNAPSTAVVFGEKGSGKTALRMQIGRHLRDYNADHPENRVFVIEYDDFNVFLDRFRDTFRRRRVEKVLGKLKVWDHLDAILALGTTQIVDRMLGNTQAGYAAAVDVKPLSPKPLDHSQRRDLLLLAACYDLSSSGNRLDRWNQLRRTLRYSTWRSCWKAGVGLAGTAATFLALYLWGSGSWFTRPWMYLAILLFWVPELWRIAKTVFAAWKTARRTRVLEHAAKGIAKLLLRMPERDLADQPLPNKNRSEDRYQLLDKLQAVLATLGFEGIVVLVDRVDEPYIINGSTDLMQALVWPMFDNKLLKYPGVGFKLLLPEELRYRVERESREFQQRARLDKQNLIRSLEWSGESLLDLTNARLKACAAEGRTPVLSDLLDESIGTSRLRDCLRDLRVPRHAFKFFYRLLVAHANQHTDDAPSWKISSQTFESVFALYQREKEQYE